MKKIFTFTLAVLISALLCVQVSAENTGLKIIRADYTSDNTVSILYLCEQPQSISLIISGSSAETADENILFLGEHYVTGTGYGIIEIPVDGEKLSKASDPCVMYGTKSQKKTVVSFSAERVSEIDGVLRILPGTDSAGLLSLLPNEYLGGISTGGEAFAGVLENNTILRFNKGYTVYNLSMLLVGDCDGNKTINAADALLCLQSSVGKISLEAPFSDAADVNQNGQTDAADALRILQHSVGKQSVL